MVSKVINKIRAARDILLSKVLHHGYSKAFFSFKDARYAYNDETDPYAPLYRELEDIIGASHHTGKRDSYRGMLSLLVVEQPLDLRDLVNYILKLTEINQKFSPKFHFKIKTNLSNAIVLLLEAFSLQVNFLCLKPEESSEDLTKLMDTVSKLNETVRASIKTDAAHIKNCFAAAISSLSGVIFSILKNYSCSKVIPIVNRLLEIPQNHNVCLLDHVKYEHLLTWIQHSSELAFKLIQSQWKYLSAEEILTILQHYQNFDELAIDETAVSGHLVIEKIVNEVFAKTPDLCGKFLSLDGPIEGCENISYLSSFLNEYFTSSLDKENHEPVYQEQKQKSMDSLSKPKALVY